MNALKDIQGVIFDYGGTIDTNSRHWAEVLWAKYVEHQIPVDKESFREAYVFGERALAKYPFVQPWHDFHDVLSINVLIIHYTICFFLCCIILFVVCRCRRKLK